MTDWLTKSGRTSVDQRPGVIDLSVYRGDSFNCPFTFVTQIDGDAYTLSGTWRAQIRADAEDPAILDSFTVDASKQAQGIVTMTLTAAQTQALPDRTVWDLENLSNDATIGTHTWLMGTLFISGDVTR